MVILLILGAICFYVSYNSFRERGFLLNNANIWNSKDGRRNLDKKLHYRQSAIGFFIIGIAFICMALGLHFYINALYFLGWGLEIVACIYAIVSSVRINKK